LARAPGLLAGALALAAARAAWAVDPFEIQVYEGDINGPGQLGLEVHANVVPAGHETAEPPARVAPDDLFRVTLEPSLGVLEWWELGAYLQMAFEPGERSGHFGGFKLRSKWIVPRRLTGDLILGLNVEVGRGTASFGTTDWDTELRPIFVWSPGRFMLAANPMVGWVLSGSERGLEPDLEPAVKGRVDTGLGFGIGLEYYAGIGHLSSPPAVRQQEHILYLAADLLDAPFDANLGVGRGLTAAANDWTVKVIVGVGF
jgi:hypothetical protein